MTKLTRDKSPPENFVGHFPEKTAGAMMGEKVRESERKWGGRDMN